MIPTSKASRRARELFLQVEIMHLSAMARSAEWQERQPGISLAEAIQHRQAKLEYLERIRGLQAELYDDV